MISDDEMAEVLRFVHRVEHLRARKGVAVLPEGEWIAECWFPHQPPHWALHLAFSGASGAYWCPQITPELAERAEI